jgi:hypothetical protein
VIELFEVFHINGLRLLEEAFTLLKISKNHKCLATFDEECNVVPEIRP